MVGFGLWNWVVGTVVVELGLMGAGIAIYFRSTRARDRIGSVGAWTLIGLLILIWVVNVFGPPPPSEAAIATVGLGLWLFVIWGFWADRHRDIARRASNGPLDKGPS